MTRQFIRTKIFDKRWAELGLDDNDLQSLENFLLKNPNAGDVMQGTGGAVKLRWALPSTSKRDGIRVIFIDLIKAEHIHLITCYPKTKKDSLTDKEKSAIKEIVKRIIKEKG